MKNLLFAALLLVLPASAWAVCPNPLTVKDAGGNPQNISTTNDASGNCQSAIVINLGGLVVGAGTDGWNVTEGTKADAAWVSGSGSVVSILKNIAGGVAGAVPSPATPAGWGIGAFGAAEPANGVAQGVEGQSVEPAAATTGFTIPVMADLVGKVATSPYAVRELMLRGSITGTDTAAHTIIAAQGASVKTYITDIECGRNDTGTSPITITFSDSAATVIILPNSGGGGGNNKAFNVPLVTAANTAFTFTSGSSITTVFCSAQGFKGY